MVKSHEDKRNGDYFDCPSCGHPVTVPKYIRHIDQCMAKVRYKGSDIGMALIGVV